MFDRLVGAQTDVELRLDFVLDADVVGVHRRRTVRRNRERKLQRVLAALKAHRAGQRAICVAINERTQTKRKDDDDDSNSEPMPPEPVPVLSLPAATQSAMRSKCMRTIVSLLPSPPLP